MPFYSEQQENLLANFSTIKTFFCYLWTIHRPTNKPHSIIEYTHKNVNLLSCHGAFNGCYGLV